MSQSERKSILFFEGWDDLSWAQPGDELITVKEGPLLVLGEDGRWEER